MEAQRGSLTCPRSHSQVSGKILVKLTFVRALSSVCLCTSQLPPLNSHCRCDRTHKLSKCSPSGNFLNCRLCQSMSHLLHAKAKLVPNS